MAIPLLVVLIVLLLWTLLPEPSQETETVVRYTQDQ